MAVPARVAIQTFHQPTNQPTNGTSVCHRPSGVRRRIQVISETSKEQKIFEISNQVKRSGRICWDSAKGGVNADSVTQSL
jgi:hypothetical protein